MFTLSIQGWTIYDKKGFSHHSEGGWGLHWLSCRIPSLRIIATREGFAGAVIPKGEVRLVWLLILILVWFDLFFCWCCHSRFGFHFKQSSRHIELPNAEVWHVWKKDEQENKGGKLKPKSALVWKKKIALEIKRRKTECKAYDLKRRLEAFQKPFSKLCIYQ